MSKRIIRQCGWCRADFAVHQSEVARGRGLFCSRACAIADYAQRRLDKRERLNCQQCGSEITRPPCLADRGNGQNRFCSRGCFDAYVASPSRFWERVDLNGPVPAHVPHLGPCAVWLGKLSSRGYGSYSVNGRSTGAHRAAWFLAEGELPTRWVLHACDNPRCVRRDHLFLGDQADNMLDMKLKGRADRAKKARAEANGSAKLTEAAVREIRSRRARGELLSELSAEFGVSQSRISLIASGKAWRSVV
jgi:hypothetical protein